MRSDAHSILVPSLPLGAIQERIISELGDPQHVGKGMGGSVLFGYREKTIQCTLRSNRLFLLAFYFLPAVNRTGWPQSLKALNAFSDATTLGDVEDWLNKQQINWQRTSIAGEEVIKAPTGVWFCFDSGRLASIQILSEEPIHDSPPSTASS